MNCNDLCATATSKSLFVAQPGEKKNCLEPSFDHGVKDDICPYDILAGRGTTAYNNCGNRRFRITVSLHFPKYRAAETRKDKSAVIDSMLHLLLDVIGARFLKSVDGEHEPSSTKACRYIEMDRKDCRERIFHALRNMAIAVAKLDNKKSEPSPERSKLSSLTPPKRYSMPSFLDRPFKRKKAANSDVAADSAPPASSISFEPLDMESDLLSGFCSDGDLALLEEVFNIK